MRVVGLVVDGLGEEVQAVARAALDGCDEPSGCKQTLNHGFLRPDAYLAVVVLTVAYTIYSIRLNTITQQVQALEAEVRRLETDLHRA